MSYESGGRKKPNGSGHQQYNLLQFWQDLSGYCNLAGAFGPLESPAKFASNREPRHRLEQAKAKTSCRVGCLVFRSRRIFGFFEE